MTTDKLDAKGVAQALLGQGMSPSELFNEIASFVAEFADMTREDLLISMIDNLPKRVQNGIRATLLDDHPREIAAWESATYMLPERFWELVKLANWPQSANRVHATKKELIQACNSDPDEVERFHNTYQRTVNALARELEKWAEETYRRSRFWGSFTLSDDSWSDLVSHIVGLGKEEYAAVMADPERGWVRARNHQYTESFSYCVPWRGDLGSLDVERYCEWASSTCEEWRDTVEPCALLNDLLRTLDAFAENEDVEAFLASRERFHRDALLSLRLKPGKCQAGRYDTVNPWAVLNLYSDVEEWLG